MKAPNLVASYNEVDGTKNELSVQSRCVCRRSLCNLADWSRAYGDW